MKPFYRLIYGVLSIMALLAPTAQASGPKPGQLTIPKSLKDVSTFCMGEFSMESPITQIDLKVCGQKEQTIQKKGGSLIYKESEGGPEQEIRWRHLGLLPNGDGVIERILSPGGSGIFSSLERAHLEGGTLTLFPITGGDRANGGIFDAYIDGEFLVFKKNFNEASLYMLGQELSKTTGAPPSQSPPIETLSLSYTAQGYGGYGTYRIPLSKLPNSSQAIETTDYLVSVHPCHAPFPDVFPEPQDANQQPIRPSIQKIWKETWEGWKKAKKCADDGSLTIDEFKKFFADVVQKHEAERTSQKPTL